MQKLVITENQAGQRLDKLLGKWMPKASQGFLYKMIRKKNITLNGKRATGQERLSCGDEVTLYLSDETIATFSGEQDRREDRIRVEQEKDPSFSLDILYEDDQVLLFNKPVGLLSQKAKKEDISAVDYLINYLLASGQMTDEELSTFRPSVCNRLDFNTSGILCAGKSLKGLQELNRFFKERTIAKYYLCPVAGVIEEPALIKGWIKKDKETNHVEIFPEKKEGCQPIETAYTPLASHNDVTLLEVHLITGKTHQIRSHLAQIHHPIIGDRKYGDRSVNQFYEKKYGLTYQLLHAGRIVFPKTDGVLEELSEKEFTADPPDLFTRICQDRGVYSWEHGIPEA